MKTFTSLKQKFTTLFLTSLTVLTMAFPVMAADTVCPPKKGVELNIPHEKFFLAGAVYNTIEVVTKETNPKYFEDIVIKYAGIFGPAPFEFDTITVTQSRTNEDLMGIAFELNNCVKNATRLHPLVYKQVFGQDA